MPDSENTKCCPQTNIPYLHLQQGDTPCLFVHANGYPSHCYQPMLEQLKGCDVMAPLSRACWDESDPNARNQWPLLVDDFIRFAQARFDDSKRPIVAIGHSMGCMVILRAACRAPQLFAKVVFIEPIFMPSHVVELSRLTPRRWLKKSRLVQKTLSRPDTWDSLQQAYDFHRPKRAFSALSDPALWQYIVGGTKAVGDSWQLKYPKAWEAWFYQHLPRAWPLLRKLAIPTLGIRAQQSEFLTVKSWLKWQKIQPHETFVEFEGQRHLVPLEAPMSVAHAILDFIE